MVKYEQKIFSTTRCDGPMSGIKDFYPEGMTRDEIDVDLLLRRMELEEKYGIDGTKIIVPSQDITLKRHSDGHYEDVTEMVSYILSDDSYYDLWNLDIPCDIMLIKSALPNVALAYPVADCPVVMLRARDTLAIAHCSSTHIDRGLPIQIVDAITKVAGANDCEVSAYIGPCAGTSYVYETYPAWANNKDWKHFITETSEGYSINLRKAIMFQLMRRGVSGVTLSTKDTITDDNYYSNYAYKHGDESKNGRFLTGTYFEEAKVLCKVKTR